MIRLGKVKGNRMVDMQLTNDKLVDRGTRMIMEATEVRYFMRKFSMNYLYIYIHALYKVGYEEAKQLLLIHKSVRNAVEAWKNSKNSSVREHT